MAFKGVANPPVVLFEVLNRTSFFNPDIPYSGCCICGDIYQSFDKRQRKLWASKHAITHTRQQHEQLRKSGRPFTPEAAQKFAEIGLIDLVALATDEDYIQAYKEV